MTALLTTDLLDVWTDPDTAMEAVGTNLGIFDEHGPSPAKALAADERLRNTLFDVLLSLVEGGALEMRPCGGGRHAFRWRHDMCAAAAAAVAPLEAPPAPAPAPAAGPVPPDAPEPPIAAAPAPPPAPAAIPLSKPPVAADVPDVAHPTAPTAEPHPPRPIAQAPLLVVPALSFLLAILVYLWFDGAVAFVIGAVLLLAGVVGMIRRVPFAGAWTLGLLIAALLVRFS